MCNKIIIDTWPSGAKTRRKCNKPEYKDGLCKKHYDNKMKKLVNWGDRDYYRDATQDDLDRCRSLKLKNTHIHKLYQCRKGVIKQYSSKANKYIECDLPADFNLFCVLDY